MLLYLLLLLPGALATYCILERDKKILLPAALSAFLAIIICACRFFFSYEHRLVYDSFSDNFFYFLLKQNFLPLVIISTLLALFSRDTAEFKIKQFFPSLCAFYAIYLPYCVITASDYYFNAYDLFLKPLIYLAMLVQISIFLKHGWQAFKDKKIAFMVIDILIILVYAIYPAVSDALYAIDQAFAVILIAGLIYSLIPAVLLVFSCHSRA